MTPPTIAPVWLAFGTGAGEVVTDGLAVGVCATLLWLKLVVADSDARNAKTSALVGA